jgi:hypothetical protein
METMTNCRVKKKIDLFYIRARGQMTFLASKTKEIRGKEAVTRQKKI